jgi:DNA polymerase-3 subunit epsilon
MLRQVVLDTETTGLDPQQGHRIIEIGCIELINRRQTGNDYRRFLNPDREIEAGAEAVHGISNAMLADKPRFPDIADELLEYLRGAELIIHNADFDIGFLDAEYRRMAPKAPSIRTLCGVLDTLGLARKMHPGQKNTLDALCRRYQVDNSRREYHGAQLDAQLLAEVYLAMTGGQTAMALDVTESAGRASGVGLARLLASARPRVLPADEAEIAAHERRLEAIRKASGGKCAWD